MKYLFAITLICFVFSSYSQTPSSQYSPALTMGHPEVNGISENRLDRIDQMVLEEIEAGHIPGAVILIARNGKIVHHKAFGKADNKTDRDLTKDEIFRIASQTKAITSTAVMMLWEKGLFRLDDPISKYIPEFGKAQLLDTFNEADSSFTTTPAQNQITIRHLLTHTSGLGYGVIDGDERFRKMYAKAGVMDLFTTQDITIEESVKRLAKLPLHHEPGSKYTYSEGLDVLGYFIEIISGMPFDEFLRKHIFDPLGMNDTWFYLPADKHDRLVTIQRKDENGKWQPLPYTFYDPDYPIKGAKKFFSGGAGLTSTTLDYAKFLQMYLNGGEYKGQRLLSRTTVQFIMQNQIGDLRGDGGSNHGLAFGLVDQKGEALGGRGSFGTFDWGGYFNTQYFADPNEQLIGLIFKQTSGSTGDQTGWKFRPMVFAAIDD